VTGFTITNKEIDTSVSASKEWVNADNTRIAPEGAEAAFRLYKNGKATDRTITLDGTADENGEKKAWTAEFDDLAKFDRNGDKIDYTIRETSSSDGYKAESTEAVSDGGVITNRQINAGAVIRGTKRMAGSAELKAGSYRFYLKDASGNIVDTAKNDADGTFTFAKIVFTEPGSKSYTISEQHAGEMINGIKYDDTEYPVTVTAEKDGDSLKTSVSYPSGSPVFTNRAVRDLTVKKVWDDDNDKNGMRPDSVAVNLMNDGEVVDTAELSEGNDWSFTFEGLDPDKDYTVSEVLAEDSGYSCDISYDGDTVTLTNEFIRTVDIKASKTLKGATLKSGEFTFRLERKSGGDPIYAVNDSEGQITFNNVPYDKEGYVVTEEAGSESGITYDKDSITYDADGNVTGEKKSFTNTKKTTEKKSEQNTPAVLRVQKTSKEAPHDPLEGAKYGLYRYVEGGNDILVEAETSDENGYMYYDKVEEGVIYYFKEISAPSGHEVDPYAGEKFMIRYDSNGQPYTCDADGNRTDIGDITRQDSSKAYVQVKKSTVDLGSIAYNESTQTLYENTADNGIKAAAIASDAAFPEGTVLKITEKKLSSKAEQNLEKKAGKVNGIVYYDIAFEKDGKEIEPETGSVRVIIQDSQSLSGAVASDLKIIHLLDKNATAIEPLKGSVTAASGNLVQMTFTADSFSTIGVVEPEDSTTFGSNYMITSAGVSDQVSELNVAKVDSKGDYVKGAKMQIFEKSSGKVVAEWTTGDGLKEFSRWFDKAQTEPMNVDTYYVLHEVSAPEGYTLADDIVFRINKYDSSITIYKFDDEGQLVEDKDAEEKWVSDTRLTMVDIPKKVVTSRRYKTRYVVRKHTVKVHGADEITREIVRTGDESQLPLLVTIMLASAAAVIVILIIRKRREEKE
jgi:pilin isopeptide linkage protein